MLKGWVWIFKKQLAKFSAIYKQHLVTDSIIYPYSYQISFHQFCRLFTEAANWWQKLTWPYNSAQNVPWRDFAWSIVCTVTIQKLLFAVVSIIHWQPFTDGMLSVQTKWLTGNAFLSSYIMLGKAQQQSSYSVWNRGRKQWVPLFPSKIPWQVCDHLMSRPEAIKGTE